MTELVVIAAGGGEIVGDAPDRRVEILSDGDDLHVTWSRFGPGREGADLHVHRRHTDLFYVLDGELTLRLGLEGEEVRVPAGTLARVPPLVVHGFRNGSDADVRYLNLHAPGRGFADFLRALRDGRAPSYDQEEPPPDGGRSTAAVAVGARGPAGPGAELLADVDEIAIAELRGEAGDPEHPRGRPVEYLYVLDGELALTVGDRVLLARTGSWVRVPPSVSLRRAPAGAAPVRYLAIATARAGPDQQSVGD